MFLEPKQLCNEQLTDMEFSYALNNWLSWIFGGCKESWLDRMLVEYYDLPTNAETIYKDIESMIANGSREDGAHDEIFEAVLVWLRTKGK